MVVSRTPKRTPAGKFRLLLGVAIILGAGAYGLWHVSLREGIASCQHIRTSKAVVIANCTALLQQDYLPRRTRANTLFRRAFIATGYDNDLAKADYMAALELRPRWTWALNNLGLIYLDQGDASTALTYFDRALAVDTDADHRRFNRARAYHQLGRNHEARADIVRILRNNLHNKDAADLLALIEKEI